MLNEEASTSEMYAFYEKYDVPVAHLVNVEMVCNKSMVLGKCLFTRCAQWNTAIYAIWSRNTVRECAGNV